MVFIPLSSFEDDDQGEDHDDDHGELTRLDPGKKLPVAGVRVSTGELTTKTHYYHARLRTHRFFLSTLASIVLLCVGVGFFANEYPAIQMLAFMATIFIPVVVAGTFAFYHFEGKPVPFLRDLRSNALYPPNALADNLREAMQAVLDTLAQRLGRDKKDLALEGQVPEVALAFTAFFGRSVDRIQVSYSDSEWADYDRTKNFRAQALAFATAVTGGTMLSHGDVFLAASRLLGSYRRLLRGREINDEQVAFDSGTIDATTLPRGPQGDDAPATRLLAQSVALLDREPDEIALIRSNDAELARVRSAIPAEDVDEWRRIVNEHVPGLETTFVNAATALGTGQEVVTPYLRALGIIGETLELILSRARTSIAGDLKTQVRFIETRHGTGPLTPV